VSHPVARPSQGSRIRIGDRLFGAEPRCYPSGTKLGFICGGWGPSMSDENEPESDDRRAFLKAAGRFAAIVPPAMTFLLSTSMTASAGGRSGGTAMSGGHGHHGHSNGHSDKGRRGGSSDRRGHSDRGRRRRNGRS
jgi:hypothetical protein